MFGNSFKTVCLHQINGFDHLTLGAVNLETAHDAGPARIYIERSFFAGDVVLVGRGTDLSALPWYRKVGLAPDEIIEVPHDCIFQGLKHEEEIKKDLIRRLSNGSRIQFFRTTQLESELIGNLGLAWGQTLSCDPAVSEEFYKADIRRIGKSIGKDDSFVPYQILPADWRPKDLMSAVHEINSVAHAMHQPGVLVRRTDLASGDGTCNWFHEDHESFMRKNQGQELLVEVLLEPHVPISNAWWILDGEIQYGWSTKLLQNGFEHKGNVLAHEDKLHDHVGRAKAMCLPFLNYAREMGYNGMLNFDFMYSPVLRKLYIAEINTRVTASYYARGLADKLKFTPWAVAFRIIEPSPDLKNFYDVREKLGRYIYDPDLQHGIVPYMLSGLRLPSGQRRLGIMSVANFVDVSEQILDTAAEILS